jgi:hypothetical protein
MRVAMKKQLALNSENENFMAIRFRVWKNFVTVFGKILRLWV